MTERLTKERIERLLWMVENDTESKSVYVALVVIDEIIKQSDEIELLQSERQTWMDKADELQQRTIAQHQENERLQARVKELEDLLDIVEDKKQTVFDVLTDTIARRDKYISELEKKIPDLSLYLAKANLRVQELEEEKQVVWEKWLEKMEKKWNEEDDQERKLIHEGKTMIVKKDGNSWFAVMPDFKNLQESESRWFYGDINKYLDSVYLYLNKSNLLGATYRHERKIR